MPLNFLKTHKGTIVYYSALAAYMDARELGTLLRQLRLEYVTKIGNKMMPAKKMQLYKDEVVGDKRLLIFANSCDVIDKCYAIIMKKSIERADKFLTDANLIDKRPDGEYVNWFADDANGVILKEEQHAYIHEIVGLPTIVGNKKPMNFTLVAKPGEGKSYMGLYLASMISGKTALILPNTLQLQEWRNILATLFPSVVVGEYHSGAPKKDGDIVIMLKASALTDVFVFGDVEIPWADYCKRFRTVLFDEVHNYPTQKSQELFWRYACRNTIGMTGTPNERQDGFDEIYIQHVGKIIEKPNMVLTGGKKWKGFVRKIEYSGSRKYTEKIVNAATGFTSAQAMARQFATDPHRNLLIIDEITRLLELDKNIYIYAEHRDTLTSMRAMLNEKFPDVKNYVLMGGVSSEDITAAAQDAKIILVTYGYASEQLSIPKMDAIVLVTSRMSKFRQILPRILRLSGDENCVREIVDIVDVETTIKSQFGKRSKVYKEYNFPVEKIQISWDKYNINAD